MKYTLVLLAMLLLAMGNGGAVSAAESGHGGHGAEAMGTPAGRGGGHEAMQKGGALIMLDTVTTDGIKAMAHLQDLRQGNSPGGKGATHNLMVVFEEEGKGTALAKGRAAVKVTAPDGRTGGTIALNSKDGFFSGDLELRQTGNYTFVVGAKLTDDDKARQFSFTYELK